MSPDHYTELGISRAATPEEVKRAFRRLTQEYHPDKRPGDAKAAARYALISAAWHVLGDPERRAKYDRTPIVVAGADERLSVVVPFWTSILGGTVEIVTGRGRTGALVVPAGAEHEQLLRVRGLGEPGSPPGDLLVTLLVEPDATYTRRGDDLERTLRVSWLAVWRCELLEVATPWDVIGLELQPDVHHGQVYEVTAHGVRRPERWGALRLRLELEPPAPRERLPADVADALEAALRAAYLSSEPASSSDRWPGSR